MTKISDNKHIVILLVVVLFITSAIILCVLKFKKNQSPSSQEEGNKEGQIGNWSQSQMNEFSKPLTANFIRIAMGIPSSSEIPQEEIEKFRSGNFITCLVRALSGKYTYTDAMDKIMNHLYDFNSFINVPSCSEFSSETDLFVMKVVISDNLKEIAKICPAVVEEAKNCMTRVINSTASTDEKFDQIELCAIENCPALVNSPSSQRLSKTVKQIKMAYLQYNMKSGNNNNSEIIRDINKMSLETGFLKGVR